MTGQTMSSRYMNDHKTKRRRGAKYLESRRNQTTLSPSLLLFIESNFLFKFFIFCVLFQRPVSVEVSDPLLVRQVCSSIPTWINLSNHCTHFKLAYLLAAACCKKSFHNTKKIPPLPCQLVHHKIDVTGSLLARNQSNYVGNIPISVSIFKHVFMLNFQ